MKMNQKTCQNLFTFRNVFDTLNVNKKGGIIHGINRLCTCFDRGTEFR